MKIVLLSKENENNWNNFIDNHKNGLIYYKTEWRDAISKEYGHDSKYYYVENKEKIIAILPLFIVHSIFKKVIISIPYCPYGGVLSVDSNAESLLINKALELAKERKVDYIELKEVNSKYKEFVNVSNHITFHLSLKKEFELIWSELSKSTKRHVKKGQKLDYKITFDSNIEVFYNLYLKHLKKIGTPPMSMRFFKVLHQNYGESFKIATIWFENNPAASILLLISNNSVIYDRGSTNYDLRHLSLNYVLFWEIIKKYSNSKFDYFDFGRSVKDSGTFQFKNGWRPKIIPLNYQYYILKGNTPNYSQVNSKRKLFTHIFKWLPRIPYIDYKIRKWFP